MRLDDWQTMAWGKGEDVHRQVVTEIVGDKRLEERAFVAGPDFLLYVRLLAGEGGEGIDAGGGLIVLSKEDEAQGRVGGDVCRTGRRHQGKVAGGEGLLRTGAVGERAGAGEDI